MTQGLVDSEYFDFAGQYDVGAASFDGSNTSGGLSIRVPTTRGRPRTSSTSSRFIECET